jgi:two-component system, cell cycle response regulator
VSDNPQSEVTQLRRQLKAYVSQAHNNEQKLRRFQEQELKFISANGLEELLNTLLYDYRRNFNLDAVTLLLLDPEYEMRHILEGLGLLQKHQDVLFDADLAGIKQLLPDVLRPRLGLCRDDCASLLFPNTHPAPDSSAIFPLVRNRQLIGTLNIGSSQPERFITGSATDFLERLAAVLAVCFENALNHERIKLLGLIDPLTGIHNRRYFDERLVEETSRAQRQGQPLSCLFLDIDHFKQFNDRFGHSIGDHVLREVANTIKSHMRASDVLARFGGEEFAILLIQKDRDEAMEIAERIRAAVAVRPLRIAAATDANITVSIGCAVLTETHEVTVPEDASRTLLNLADQALYQAKEAGRNRVCSTD